jgi:hypothetical protein
MKKLFISLMTTCIVAINFSAQAQITGIIFRDYNNNGTRETVNPNEPFVAGVTVKAFNAANVQVGATKTTDAAGAYSFTAVEIPSTLKVRIEFSGISASDASSFNGTGNGTNVQFVTAPNTTTNYAVNYPNDYSQTNPRIIVPMLDQGSYVGNTRPGIGSFLYNSPGVATNTGVQIQYGGPAANLRNDVAQSVIGSTWGIAHQKNTNRVFASSFLRRGSPLADGPGFIYVMDYTTATPTLAHKFNLQGIAPANGGANIDLGTVTRTYITTGITAGAAGNNQVPPPGNRMIDLDAFGKVGRMSFGDNDLTEDGKTLWVVNLFQRALIKLDVSNNTATTIPTLSTINQYILSGITGYPAAPTTGVLRPWALKFYKGRGYLGVVNDAATGARANLVAYVLSFDPNNITAGFTTEITVPLSYGRANVNDRWKPWLGTTFTRSNTANTADFVVFSQDGVGGTGFIYAQPILSDIEFDANGNMLLALRDRLGDLFGGVTEPVSGSTVDAYNYSRGDLLKACKIGSSFIIEGGAGCGVNTTGSWGVSGNGEFFTDWVGDGSDEGLSGGLGIYPGTNELVSTVLDPQPVGQAGYDPAYVSSQGVHKLNLTNGTQTAYYQMEPSSITRNGKGNGLGDLEILSNLQPLQIGNRIWLDANADGIQGADETTAGVPTGTIVTLRSPGINGIFGDADDQTWTTTTDANGNYYFSTLATADNRKPTSWTGIGNTILPGYDYRVEVVVPAGNNITQTDVSSNGLDNIDNDASLNGTNAAVTFNTGNTNHNFDIGFKTLASLGNKVWLDEGLGGGTAKDGIQNGTEPGVAGVTVSLLNNAGVVIATTVTDAFGNYLFDNLVAGTYSVRVTPPANHSFTTQTNTIDDNNTTGASTTGSDVNVTTGQSYPVLLSAGENNRNIDAGLIFTTPVATNSIGDRIWFDNGLGGGTAGNGVQDGTEPGVAGVTVTLYAADGITVIATTVTDANGNYVFNNLPATTNYIIGVTPPAGTIFATTTGTTTANGNSDVNATLGSATYGKTTAISTGVAGTQVTGIDAGIVSQAAGTASLGDRVWNDLNNNGTQDAGEPGIAGVTVNLYEDANGDGVLAGAELTAVRTAVTDAFGNYIFNNLLVTTTNKWQVEFVQPAGYTNTAIANNNSGADETDSDISNNATDRTDFIRLKADDRNTSVDAGFVLTAPAGTLKLGDKVWRDDNANGQQDATEVGVAGVTVKLYQNGVDGLPGTADDVLVATKTTDINGNYLFTNLAASTTAATNYNVQFSNIPANFSFTSQNVGVTATDNNANSVGKTGSINLTADDLTIDAGIKQGAPAGTASLGNRVWYDLNTNGVQDGIETGVANVTVSLYRDANNDGLINGAELTAVATTTTNALGEYMFTNLAEGSYQVGFNLPAALSTYTLTTKDTGADDAIDSDGNPKNTSVSGNTAAAQTSFTGLIALATGEDNTTVDVGIVPPANTNTIGNKVWWDQNASGIQDATEPGVAGVIVKLYNDGADNIAGNVDDLLIGTTTSDINGNYLFVGLTDDTYYANFSNVPAGFDFTTKETTNVAATDVAGSDADRVSGTTGTVQLINASGLTFKDNRSLDAGIVSTRALLGNKIFDDLNGDGIQTVGEPGVAGVQVILYAADGTTVLSSTITDANGNYIFANLTTGTYVVGVNAATIPVGMQFTTQDNTTGPDGDGVNTATGGGDSDVNPATGKTNPITLTAGQANLTVDAGIRRTPVATVGNRVWDDANGNGIQDAGEAGIPGVIATLYNNAGVAIGSAVTDVNGNWLINNVPVGTGYYVIFTNKPKGNFTIQDNGGIGTGGATDSDTDSDVNASGQTGTFDVTPNTLNVKIDAGIVKGLASLGSKVWLDNGTGSGIADDGIQNGTEPGVAGVGVNLYVNGADGLPGTDDDVLVGTTITDAYGNYLFENLAATSGLTTQYNVRITPPANYVFTTQTNTTDDNNTTGLSTTGSDVNVLGVSYGIDLSAGENNPNIDAGLVLKPQAATNSIGDKVWFDANGDGVNNGGVAEPGVAGVTVTLYDDLTGNIVAITKTDANGNYIFNNLPAGTNYKVGFSAPGGTVLTTGGVLDISNTSTNSDPNATTGLTATINTGAAGTQITGVDAGLKNDVKGALGDLVWNDINNNGIQDAGEPGVPGVTMRLYATGADGLPGGAGANADVLIGTVTTDANGYYIFPNLDPAKYFVVATPIAGYTVSAKDVANPLGNTKDNDFANGTAAYAGNYVSSVFTLLPITGGVTRDMTVDLGIHNNAPTNTLNTLGDKVWNDLNKNGLLDGTEAGVPNVTVRLLNSAGVAVNNPATGKPYVTVTDANGNYKFVDLVDGNYIVEFANIPVGYSFTGLDVNGTGNPVTGTADSDAKTTTGRTGTISVDALSASATSVNIVTVDAGISQGVSAGTASLGNRVWYDLNNNGVQDATELGVANVKVELLNSVGAVVNVPGTSTPYVVYTNGLGEYLFTGLPAGDYTVRFSRFPAGYTSSTANTGTNDAIDADASFAGISATATTTATTAVYTLQTGEDNLTVDMGILPAAGTNSVGNFVWNDFNADGLQTAGEPGVAGVTVKLYTNGADGLPGTADDIFVATTTTDNAGAYIFVGLPDGNYNVSFENLPSGGKLTTQTVGTATGSDANPATGRTGTIALDPTSLSATSVNNTDIDAGITNSTAALGNFVWIDTNGDGVQDANEKGVSGVTVLLYAADGTTVLASTVTDADGKYYFGNLTPASYVVGFSNTPANLTFTKQNTAGDNGNNTNSDADPVTGKTAIITLVANEIDLTIDAGLKPENYASVGDYVWSDLNGNGIQDATENGVPGIIVTLKDALDNVIGTAITDGNGKYLIEKIPAAPAGTTYYIVFSNLPGTSTFTTQTDNVTATDATNGSDAALGTGRTSNFILLPGQYLPNVDAGITNVLVVPIKYVSFTANASGNQTLLQWEVSEQTNVVSYDVETSTDGRTFVKFATKQAVTTATYNAVHNNPVAGINYYRIKTTDKDGTVNYSEIRKVTFGKTGTVVIFPNPAPTSTVNISLTGSMTGKAAIVTIINMEGKIVSNQRIVSTNQTETLNISTLASGNYIVRIATANEVLNTKLVVAK